MRYALLADLHANLPALQACLAHARAEGAEAFAVLGDLVGYGPQPEETVQQVRALADAGAIVLRGNHDQAAVTPPEGNATTAEGQSAQWTHERLGPDARDWLASLPLTERRDTLLFVHASADTPERWDYVDHPVRAQRCLEAAGDATHVFCGHVHHQCLFYRGRGRDLLAFEPTAGAPVPVPAHRRWVATVGSVGQPRDGDPRAMYAMLDTAAARLTFHRIPYDLAAAVAAIRRAGLPAAAAERLERGR